MEVYLSETGIDQRESLLFIHGAGLPGWSWQPQVSFFSSRYHCIVVDLPDHGKSRDIPFGTIEEVAELLVQVIRDIAHDGHATIIGHSLGAKIALAMLVRDPSTIDRAVIASALCRPSPLISMMNSRSMIRFSLWLLKRSSALKRYQVRSFRFPTPEMEQMMLREYDELTVDGYCRYIGAFAGALELPSALGDLTNLPVLILAGTREVGAMKGSARMIQERIPGSTAVLLEGCNHLYPIQHAELFNSTVDTWLTQHPIMRTTGSPHTRTRSTT